MVNDSKNNDSVYSKKSKDLLSGMKRYLRIEHKDDDKELLEYLRKQAGLHIEQRSDSAFESFPLIFNADSEMFSLTLNYQIQ